MSVLIFPLANNLPVSSPHQPLMQRVQLALQAQLTRQNEKLEVERREKVRTYIHMYIFTFKWGWSGFKVCRDRFCVTRW